MSRRRRILDHYEPRIDASRASHEILDWASASSQRARFAVFAENVRLGGKSLLDVGCGLGDLWAYLKERHIVVHYTGVDLSQKMLNEAARRHGDARFVCADLFDGLATGAGLDADASFNVVFCSGIFNLNLGNNSTFLAGAVSRLKALARECVVFNLLHIRAGGPDRRYAYYDPPAVLAVAGSDGWQVRLLEDYLPNDFTVICTKPG